MNELLFENAIEREALENILALNQIKKCDVEISRYSNEIKELNDEMTNILKEEDIDEDFEDLDEIEEDIDEDYVEKIHKYKSVLSSLEGENGRILELDNKIKENEKRINEFQEKAKEIEDRLEVLKNEIFETDNPSKVIDCQNEIETNNIRLNDVNEILSKLISDNTPLLIEKEYLTAKNSGVDFNVPNFNKTEIQNDLDRITKIFNEQIEKLDLPIRENIEFCQKKIRNRELEIEKFNARKNMVIDSFPNSLNLDVNKAYEEVKNLLCELELTHDSIDYEDKNIFNDEDEVEIPTEEIKPKKDTDDIKEEIVAFSEEEPVMEETVKPELKEKEEIETPKEVKLDEETVLPEPTLEEEKVEEETKDESEEIGSVSYVLSDGESLMNIAEKVYPSKDNWEEIYYLNKEAIDKYLVSNGISSDFETIKELANDTSLFTGIKLEIPTDYNYKI